jgi:hypothetical protein
VTGQRLTRQEMTDALGDQFMLATHPRREWLIEQIMLLHDVAVATAVDEALAPYREAGP